MDIVTKLLLAALASLGMDLLTSVAKDEPGYFIKGDFGILGYVWMVSTTAAFYYSFSLL